MLKKKDINGLDVLVWAGRHIGYLMALLPVIGLVTAVVWVMYFEPKGKAAAKELDKPIIKRVTQVERKADKINKRTKSTHYIVRKMELVQTRTSPAKVVKEAEEEIDLEKERDME